MSFKRFRILEKFNVFREGFLCRSYLISNKFLIVASSCCSKPSILFLKKLLFEGSCWHPFFGMFYHFFLLGGKRTQKMDANMILQIIAFLENKMDGLEQQLEATMRNLFEIR
jgi:hypothetical protein